MLVVLVAGSGSSASVRSSWVPTDLIRVARQRYPPYVEIRPIGFGTNREVLWTAREKGAAIHPRPYTDGSIQHIFGWRDGTTRDLGSFGQSDNSVAAVNARDQIAVTRFAAPFGGPLGQMPPIPPARAFLWEKGRFTALGTLGGRMSFATAIDESGRIVGWSQTTLAARGNAHGFLWQSGKMTDLGTLGGKTSDAEAINDRGQVVGSSETSGGEPRGFLWQNGKMMDLGTLGRWSIDSVAINDLGQVIGRGIDRSTTNDRVYLWEKGKLTDLGVRVDPNAVLAINDADEVIGTTGHEGFVWQSGKLTMLGTLGRQTASPTAIDDRGQIVGGSASRNFRSHAFLWRSGSFTTLPSPVRLSSAPTAWIDPSGTRIVAASWETAGLHTRILVWTLRPGAG